MNLRHCLTMTGELRLELHDIEQFKREIEEQRKEREPWPDVDVIAYALDRDFTVAEGPDGSAILVPHELLNGTRGAWPSEAWRWDDEAMDALLRDGRVDLRRAPCCRTDALTRRQQGYELTLWERRRWTSEHEGMAITVAHEIHTAIGRGLAPCTLKSTAEDLIGVLIVQHGAISTGAAETRIEHELRQLDSRRWREGEGLWASALHLLATAAMLDQPALIAAAEGLASEAAAVSLCPGVFAYVCGQIGDDQEPAHYEVIFAHDEVHAKVRMGVRIGDLDSVTSIKRMPGWDAYAKQGDVPAALWLKAKYMVSCRYCEHQIHPDEGCTECAQEAQRPGHEELDLEVVTEGMHAWCSKACHRSDCEEHAAMVRAKEQARQRVRVFVHTTWPFVTVINVSSPLSQRPGFAYDGLVRFRFPGAAGTGSYSEADGLRIETQDMAVWQARLDDHGLEHGA